MAFKKLITAVSVVTVLLETIFTGRLIKETAVGPYKAVVPTIGGQAWITGFNTYVLDPSDPFPEGFRVGDIWPMRTNGRSGQHG